MAEMKIISNKRINSVYLLMLVEEAEKKISTALPGQFVMIKVNDGYDPLLRRPMSICMSDRKAGMVSFLYQVVGKGTELLSEKKAGEFIDILGPYGSSFELPEDIKKVFLVAGGVGIAPLIFLSDRLKDLNREIEILTFIGGSTKDDILLIERVKANSDYTYIASEDGSIGKKGRVTFLLEEYLFKQRKKDIRTAVYGCGPEGMLKKVSDIAKQYSFYCQISLDKRMACGIGVCMGCVVPVKDAPNKFSYLCTCTDGPVFNALDLML